MPKLFIVMEYSWYSTIHSRGGSRILTKGGTNTFFINSFPLCGLLMGEFLCYCHFHCFLKLNFLVVNMFSASVLFLRKQIIQQLIKKRGGASDVYLPRSASAQVQSFYIQCFRLYSRILNCDSKQDFPTRGKGQ